MVDPTLDTLDVILEICSDFVVDVLRGYGCYAVVHVPPKELVLHRLPNLHFTHPYQLLRGQFPALIVSQAGSDPWAVPELRQRGVPSLSQAPAPLWVLDGMPGVEPLLLDRHSLQSVKLLRRPVDLARHGLQAGAGVLEVATTERVDRPFAVRYQGQLTVERATRLPRVATAAEYRERFGPATDFGFSTDWMEEVTQGAVSQGHQLGVSGRKNATQWQVEGGLRDVQGVGRRSEWTQYTGRLQVQQNIGGERLKIKAQAAGQLRQGERDYAETFFYATKMNPTAPVRFEERPNAGPLLNSLYDFSSMNLRDYFELVNSTDHFNPVAIQEASSLLERRAATWLQTEVALQITDPLRLTLAAGRQTSDATSGEENRTYGYYRSVRELNVPGRARRAELEERRQWLRTALEWEQALPVGLLNLTGDYRYQSRDLERRRSSGFGFNTDDFTFEDFELLLNDATALQQDNYDENTRLLGFGLHGTLRWRWLEWETTARYEGARALGEDVRWQPTGGTHLELGLNEIFNINSANQYELHGGYAQIAQLPRDLTYARGQYDPAADGYPNENPTLGPERQRMLNAGLGWTRYSLSGGIDYTASRTTDLIVKTLRQDLPPNLNEVSVNLHHAALLNRTWAFNLTWQTNDARWQTRLRWARLNTRIAATGEAGPSGFFDTNGQHLTQASGAGGFVWLNGLGLVELDAPFGQIVGQQFDATTTAATGEYTVAETFAGKALPAPFDHYGLIGNALPTQTLSWENTLRHEHWRVDMMLRGDFGHELAHLRRLELESYVNQVDNFPQARNYLITAFDLPPTTVGLPVFSDRYVESASYLSLDYLSLQREIDLRGDQRLTVSITAQNMLLWTAYSGTDPSPRYVDEGVEVNGNRALLPIEQGQLAPGLDRRAFYPRSRALTLGVRWEM